MRHFLVFAAILLMSCKTEPPTPKPDSQPSKTEPSTAPTSEPTVTNPTNATPWPERPASVMGELRVEGLFPTVQAALIQARKVSSKIPPVEAALGIGVASLFGLTDVGALDVSRAYGAVFVDTPQSPSGVFYLGITSEESFRKSLPATSLGGESKGNALVFTPANSKLGDSPLYLNFIGSHVVGSTSAEAFSLCKSYLEEITARPLSEPSIWVSIEVVALMKRYEAQIDKALAEILRVVPSTPGTNVEQIFTMMRRSFESADEVELRYSPSGDAIRLSLFVKPVSGSGFDVRLKKELPVLVGLEKKLPVGWMSGSMYFAPEEMKAWAAVVEAISPSAKDSGMYSYDYMTGEMAFSSGMSGDGLVLLMSVTDEEKAMDEVRGRFSKEKRVKMSGSLETTYSALQKDAETIAGASIDRLEIKSTGSTPLPSGVDLSSFTVRMAYQPGISLLSYGTSTALLESILKGDASTFEASKEVREAFAEIPRERYGAIFFSAPVAMKVLLPLFLPGWKAPIDEMRSGIALAWWRDAGRLRFDIIVPVGHIQELLKYAEQSSVGESK